MGQDKQTFSLAYSPCPNDTYIFHALAHNLIDTGDMDFNITLADVETLNQKAAAGEFDITKLSFAAFGSLREKYALLRSGAALGRGCGPLVISRPGTTITGANRPVVAIPGLGTTAYLLFRFYLEEHCGHLTPQIRTMPFDQVMPSVVRQEADFGIIIHEGRFVYDKLGLDCLVDLGQWWEEKTALPIPLGCIAVKRSLLTETASRIETLIKESIAHADNHPTDGIEYIKSHAQELSDGVIKEHIRLYVNDFSRDIGGQGESAVKTFLQKAETTGLIAKSQTPLFS
ncbi:MAG TPA: 1,4-dihydroxy-6-naphthoate synthase [Desulfotignum sp.]|nr:1,4-dihydroxy-6-naphthoate synthase [Desulfotignum sp.]